MSHADTATAGSERGTQGDGGLRVWPLPRPALWTLAKGGAVLLVFWTAIGLFFMQFLDDGPVGDADRAGAEWLEDHRTSTWNSLTHYGSMMSETLVKTILVVVVGAAMVAIWRRWHDGVFLAVTVILEATVFVISSVIVGRDRPPVEHLDDAAPSGSFPSGHSAAAVAFYVSLFVIIRWHTQNRAVRAFFAVVAVAVPIIVAVSRVFRGMHHPIDVVAGLLLGAMSIAVVRAAMTAAPTSCSPCTATVASPKRSTRFDSTPDASSKLAACNQHRPWKSYNCASSTTTHRSSGPGGEPMTETERNMSTPVERQRVAPI